MGKCGALSWGGVRGGRAFSVCGLGIVVGWCAWGLYVGGGCLVWWWGMGVVRLGILLYLCRVFPRNGWDCNGNGSGCGLLHNGWGSGCGLDVDWNLIRFGFEMDLK